MMEGGGKRRERTMVRLKQLISANHGMHSTAELSRNHVGRVYLAE